MATSDKDAVPANEATGFSGFGGHLLTSASGLPGDSQAVLSALASLGIEDAEQVIAVAAIPEVRPELQRVLGLKEAAFQKFLEQIQGMVPAPRAAAFSAPSPKDLGMGVRPPTPEMLAAAREMPALEEMAPIQLPTSVNLVPYFQPIRNQGPRGTCVSFALTALNEYIERRRGIVRDLSEQDLYYGTKQIDGSPAGCGTWQVKAVTVLSSKGECREIVWPYLNALPCNNFGARPAAATADALNNRLATLAVPVHSVATYKAHMAKQRPVTISIPVYNSWYASAATRQTGRITMRIGNEPSVGGHAVCLVGYVDTPTSPGGGYFIVRNSWGTAAFGSACPFGAGYGTIPYQYIVNDAWEAFTAVVPGINAPDDGDDHTDTDTKIDTGKATVTIKVGSNVKIIIEGH